jgi:glucuronate isomerase
MHFVKEFMAEDFLLDTATAKELFAVASAEPIFDYHCHLSPREIYEDKPFENIAEIWLSGDHYKWRAMRGCGVEEKYITGDADWYEKFRFWAEVLPCCIGNPLYHWTHLELRRYFGIDTPLSAKTSDEIWNMANEKIRSGGFSPRALIQKSSVAALCTTDDPADDLTYHSLLRRDKSFGTKVLPAFRPDNALHIEARDFPAYIDRLSNASGVTIRSFEDLQDAMDRRVSYFSALGCVASDHGFSFMPCREADGAEVNLILCKALAGEVPDEAESEKYMTALLRFLCSLYVKHGIAMELHVGATRDNNKKMLRSIGPNTGFDSVGDRNLAEPLSCFLNSLEEQDSLPKTILFAMNPKDNYVLGAMTGNFQSGEVASKLQFGAAWWMNDHIDGMRRQMTDLANLGVLGKFIGMVTDSRSFLSYPRHEYFRRILCGLIGGWVESGQYPYDTEALETIVEGISFINAKTYFGI